MNLFITYSSNIAYVDDTGCDDIGNGTLFVRSVSGLSVSSFILIVGKHTKYKMEWKTMNRYKIPHYAFY